MNFLEDFQIRQNHRQILLNLSNVLLYLSYPLWDFFSIPFYLTISAVLFLKCLLEKSETGFITGLYFVLMLTIFINGIHIKWIVYFIFITTALTYLTLLFLWIRKRYILLWKFWLCSLQYLEPFILFGEIIKSVMKIMQKWNIFVVLIKKFRKLR